MTSVLAADTAQAGSSSTPLGATGQLGVEVAATTAASTLGSVGESASGGLRTEFAFTLPLGYVDSRGERHRDGVMRLATARDEILPLRDPRVRDNEAYLTVLLLARVVTQLGTITDLSASIIEGLFAPDLAFLQQLYVTVNREGRTEVMVGCPHCTSEFAIDLAGAAGGGPPGGS